MATQPYKFPLTVKDTSDAVILTTGNGHEFARINFYFSVANDKGGTLLMEVRYVWPPLPESWRKQTAKIEFDLLAHADRTRIDSEGAPEDFLEFIVEEVDGLVGLVLDVVIERIQNRVPWDHAVPDPQLPRA